MKLTIIRGIPGSGKTTKAQEIIQEYEQKGWPKPFHFEADMFFIRPNGLYDFNRSLIKAAHSWCQSNARHCLQFNEDVIVSNTFVKKWEMQPYIDMADNLNAEIEIIKCTGAYENIHGVPAEVIERMKASWEEI